MPGFLGVIGNLENSLLFSKNTNYNLINDKKKINDLFIERRTVKKFINDKVFVESDNYFILLEGVILNSLELINKYSENGSFFETIILMFRKYGNDFFGKFRGSFSGMLYDKKNNKKIIFTNHIGDKQVFFSKVGKTLIFGSEVNYIVDYYNRNNIDYTLNKEAAYQILTYGYLLEDNTLFNEIKKLVAGHYILIENDKMSIVQYYKVENTNFNNHSEKEIIENVDFLFRQAVKRAFDKDREYGYKHLVGLSGGLDSRMTTWVANDMGYGEDIVNFTFSQSNYLDEIIAKEIASDLRHEWIFKSLDNGLFLKDIENTVRISFGGVLYYGLAHGKSFLDLINFCDFGIVHSGQVGGILKGYYNKNDTLKRGGNYSNILLEKVDYSKLREYNNEGEFQLYNRQFNGTLQGNLPIQENTETVSPFLDIDFVNYCLKIPEKYEENDLFIKWMIMKYPKSTKYIWETTGGKVTDKKINIFGRQVLLKKLPKKAINFLLRRMGILKNTTATKKHMNPLNYWYLTNNDLREFMDNYYLANINRMFFDKSLKKDCEFLYQSGNNIEKIQVLTLLAVLKLYFEEKND